MRGPIRVADPMWIPAVTAVAGLAFVLRLQMEVRGGGLGGIGAYDDGVHFAAAASMVHGRVPYRDFIFLQPPGMLLAASPFAFLAELTGDLTALRAFRIAFELIGAANAVMVMVVLRRFGWTAAMTGGVFYAVFAAAVYDERTGLLEPVGTLGVLAALALLLRAHEGDRRCFTAAGLALGIACDFKIWYLVAAAVVLACARGGRVRVLVGVAITGAIAYLPFFVLAPSPMSQQVVLDQLGRPRQLDATLGVRLKSLLGVSGIRSQASQAGVSPNQLLVVLVLLTAAAAAVALLDRRSRVVVAIGGADLAVVLTAPSFFPHYDSLVAPLLAVLVGAAVGWLAGRLPRHTERAALGLLIVLLIAALNVRHDLVRVDTSPPDAALRSAAARIPGCIVSDDPTVLEVMGVLTRDLDHGCPVRPDVSGYSYGPDALTVAGEAVPRARNARYQADVRQYLQSGAASIVIRSATGLDAASRTELDAGPVLFRDGRWVIRGTR